MRDVIAQFVRYVFHLWSHARSDRVWTAVTIRRSCNTLKTVITLRPSIGSSTTCRLCSATSATPTSAPMIPLISACPLRLRSGSDSRLHFGTSHRRNTPLTRFVHSVSTALRFSSLSQQHDFSLKQGETSNQSMERTATHCAFTPCFTRTSSLRATRVFGGPRSSLSR